MSKLSVKDKFHIGIAKQGPYFVVSIVNASLLIFYTDYVGMTPFVFGVIFLIFGFWNAINDPLLGYYSDRYYLKGKKRLSMMKISIPIFIMGFLIVILQTPISDQWLMGVVLLIGLLIYESGKAVFDVNYQAYSLSVVQDPLERSKLNMFISYVGIIPGALVGLIPTFILTGKNFSYSQVILLFVILTIIPCLISFYSTTRMPPLRNLIFIIENTASIEKPFTKEEPISVKLAFKQTMQSKPFKYYIGFVFCTRFYQAVYLSNLIYMMNAVISVGNVSGVLIAAIGGIVINILYPLQTKLQKKHGSVKVLIATQIIGAIGYLLMLFSIDLVSLLVAYAISTVALSGLYLFESVLLGDVTDKDYYDTGKEKRALFASISSFFITLAGACALFLVTIFLTIFNYDGDLGIQSEFTQIGIRIMAAVIPIIAIILIIIILRVYPLQKEKYAEFRVQYLEFIEEKGNSET